MSFKPLLTGSPTQSKESVEVSLKKVNDMLQQLFNTNPEAFDWNDFSYTIIPSTATQDLGSALKPWRSLYLSADTLHLGNVAISVTPQGKLTVGGDELLSNISYADIQGAPTALGDFTNDIGFITADNLTEYATESYVATQLDGLVNSAPGALNTLGELASALGNDTNFATTVTNLISAKANSSSLSSVAFSGDYNDLDNTPLPPTIPSSVYVGTTNVAFNRASGALTLTGVSIDGNAATVTNGVVTTGSYSNPSWITELAYGKLSGTPTLATVATSGSYADLTNKPTFSEFLPDIAGNSGKYLMATSGGLTWSTVVGGGGSGMSFSTIAISGQGSVVADSAADTLTLIAGSNITLTTVPSNDIIIIDAAGGTLPTRTTAGITTPSLTASETFTGTITGFKSYVVYKIATSTPAWVRLYVNAAKRTADASRIQTADPAANSGVIAEVITTGNEVVYITPGAYGFNDEFPVTTDIPVAITNLAGGSTPVTVTLTIVQTEA
jgi:hypothetical protein